MGSFFFRRWFRHRAVVIARTVPTEDQLSPAEAQFQTGLELAAAQDFTQAAKCYTQAAERGHACAQFHLAAMYAQGQGVARDESRSLMWMTRAAELGDAGAQYRLGVHQHLACRQARDGAASERRIEALKWVRLAAAQGYHGAQGASEYVALNMTREEVTEGGRRAGLFLAAHRKDEGSS